MTLPMRRIGRTDLTVTELGLGGGPLGGIAPTDAEARAVVDAAYAAGVRYFDCAPLYGGTRSEHIVGDGLRAQSECVLSTKVGHLMMRDPSGTSRPPGFPFRQRFDYTYDGAMRSFEDSFQRLGLDRIDILYLHDLDLFTHGDRYPEMFEAAMAGAYRALDELRRSGDIKAIGLGVNDARPVAEALDRGQWDAFLLAGRYTLLEQETALLLDRVRAHGASVVVGGPFNSGILAGRGDWNYRPAPDTVIARVARLLDICSRYRVPLGAAALQFPLTHPAVASVIPGPRSVAELKEIVSWLQVPIPDALWHDLKANAAVQ
jgi:D-threo-aldose 1-dehydrogenase